MEHMGATKALPKELAEHVAAEVAKYTERYVRADGEPMSQRQIAARMKIAQPVLSAVLSINSPDDDKKTKRDRSLGINTVLKLREAMRVSLDDLLGLPPLTSRDFDARHARELATATEALLESLWGFGFAPSTHSETGRLVSAVIRAHERVTGEKFSAKPRKKGAA